MDDGQVGCGQSAFGECSCYLPLNPGDDQPHVRLRRGRLGQAARQYISCPGEGATTPLVVEVPKDGLFNAALEILRCSPAKLGFKLRRINGIALVMTGPISDETDQ